MLACESTSNDLVHNALAFYLFYARFQFHLVATATKIPPFSRPLTPFALSRSRSLNRQKYAASEAEQLVAMEFVFDFIKVDLNMFFFFIYIFFFISIPLPTSLFHSATYFSFVFLPSFYSFSLIVFWFFHSFIRLSFPQAT